MDYKKTIEQSEKEEKAYERKQRRWCVVSLDDARYEGDWFTDNNTPASIVEYEESKRRVEEFKKTLTPTQLRRLEIKENNSQLSYAEIALIEGVNVRAIWETFEQIKKKYKKIFDWPSIKRA